MAWETIVAIYEFSNGGLDGTAKKYIPWGSLNLNVVGDTNETGRHGERLAANFLESKGFEIVERNYRCGRAEIDLIARKDRWLLFVEVKTRTSSSYGHPEEFVDTGKMGRLYFAAEQYIYRINWQGHVRFDVVSVKLGREAVITHFEDAIS